MNSMISSFLGGSEIDVPLLSQAEIEFYKLFEKHDSIESAEVASYEVTKKRFALYKINVKTKNLAFSVKHRYSEFYEFIKSICLKYRFEFPLFPKKNLLRSIDPEFLKTRKLLLNETLSRLNVNYRKENCIEYLGFLKVMEHYQKHKINLSQFHRGMIHSKDEEYIIQFLQKLSLSPMNLISMFRSFEESFFEKRHLMSEASIRILFDGEGSLKGLLNYVGKIEESENNHMICSRGLSLLIKLLDHEHNKDTEFFIKMFISHVPDYLKVLKLGEHVKTTYKCSLYSLKLANIIVNRNPFIQIEKIFPEPECQHKYEMWAKRNMAVNNYSHARELFDLNSPNSANNFQIEFKSNTIRIDLHKNSYSLDGYDDSFEELKSYFNKIDQPDLWIENPIKNEFNTQETYIKSYTNSTHNHIIQLKMRLKLSATEAIRLLIKQNDKWNPNILENKVLKDENEFSLIFQKYTYRSEKPVFLFFETKIEERLNKPLISVKPTSYTPVDFSLTLDGEKFKCVSLFQIEPINATPGSELVQIVGLMKPLSIEARDFYLKNDEKYTCWIYNLSKILKLQKSQIDRSNQVISQFNLNKKLSTYIKQIIKFFIYGS